MAKLDGIRYWAHLPLPHNHLEKTTDASVEIANAKVRDIVSKVELSSSVRLLKECS
jgi:hypothetical protein